MGLISKPLSEVPWPPLHLTELYLCKLSPSRNTFPSFAAPPPFSSRTIHPFRRPLTAPEYFKLFRGLISIIYPQLLFLSNHLKVIWAAFTCVSLFVYTFMHSHLLDFSIIPHGVNIKQLTFSWTLWCTAVNNCQHLPSRSLLCFP